MNMMLRTPTVGVSTARSLSTAVAMKDQSTETVAPIWLRKLLKAVSAVIFIYKLYFVYIYLIIYIVRENFTLTRWTCLQEFGMWRIAWPSLGVDISKWCTRRGEEKKKKKRKRVDDSILSSGQTSSSVYLKVSNVVIFARALNACGCLHVCWIYVVFARHNEFANASF